MIDGLANLLGMRNNTKIKTPNVVSPSAANYELPNYEQNKQKVNLEANLAKNRAGASMTGATIDQAQANQARQRQLDLYNQMLNRNQSILSGAMPSLAERQLVSGQDRSIAQATGALASTRGLNPALAARLLQSNLLTQGQANAADAAVLRMQEEQQAANNILGIGNQFGSMRQNDLAVAQAQAGLTQGANASNLQAEMNQRALNDAMQQYFTTQSLGLDRDKSQLMQNFDANRTNASIAQGNLSVQAQAIQNQINIANQQATQSLWGNILGGASSLLSKYSLGGEQQQGAFTSDPRSQWKKL